MDRTSAIRSIRDAANILEMVTERVKLRKSGSGWLGGPCPIHGGGARTACVSVQPDKGTWHCFGCGEGGDAYDWLQKVHGLTFEEALEDLSKRTGIALPTRESKHQADGPEERILKALAEAQEFYAAQILKAPEAMKYLTERGITEETVHAVGIGYAPPGWESTTHHLEAAGVRPEFAELAGISVRSQRGTLIDMLRDRITVPIRDQRGRVIAFGGRTMPGAPPDSPKYLNTKETPVFKKGETVFNLHRARAFLREEGAMVVEGYFDVIALGQQGINNAVAPLGTALTEQHLHQIGRWTKRLTLGFDGDGAGEKATEKALTLALPAGFDVRLLALPPGEDPDSWVRAQGAAAKGLIAAAPDWATFAMDRAKVGRDFRRIEDRLAAAREVAEWIAYLPSHRQDEVTIAAAHDLKVPPQSLKPPPRAKARVEPPQARPAATEQPMDDAVQALVVMAAKRGAYLTWAAQVPRSWWDRRPGAWILETLLDAEGDAEALGSEAQKALRAAEARQATVAQVDPKRLLLRLEKEYLQRETQEVARRLATHASEESMAALLQSELTELRARMARFNRGIR